MTHPTPKAEPAPRSDYRVFRTIGTRWMDNDVYGHVNNVVYYSWFDTVVNGHLVTQGKPLTSARGHFVHVYVDEVTRRPVPLPEPLKAVLLALR